MIAHLRGRLLEKHPNRVIVDVNGVGYDVHVPLSTFYEMAEPGEEIALRIHTHVREDALLLYGFATTLELQIFERLISVSGIGPKLALAVLSGIEPNELVSAIRTANVARLTGIPGIGKKIAERIGLELKDKMASFLPAEMAASPATAAGETLRARRAVCADEPRVSPSARRARSRFGSQEKRGLQLRNRPQARPAGVSPVVPDHVLHAVRCMKARNFCAAILVILAAFVVTSSQSVATHATTCRQARGALAGAGRHRVARPFPWSRRCGVGAAGWRGIHVGRDRHDGLQSRLRRSRTRRPRVERQARPRSTDRSRRVANAVGDRLSPAADVLREELAALGRPRRTAAWARVSEPTSKARKSSATGRGRRTNSSTRSRIAD